MAENRISQAVASDLTSEVTDFSVDTIQTDGPTGDKETTYINTDWEQQLGYYKKIPELRTAIDAIARWSVGKGFVADEITEIILLKIKGNGKDTFNTILENMIRTYHIGGDSFAEIIRDEEGNLINLKPLDPSTIKIIANSKGIITRYEQVGKTKKTIKKFREDEILHLSRNRLADEIHGVSLVDSLETIILMRNEAMQDYKQVLHRFVKPRWIIKLDTDDSSEISAFKTKMDQANEDGENMYIPMGSIELEQMSISPNSTLSPLSWITNLNNYFFQACGVPQIIVGGSNEYTEATAKIAYLAWEQNIEEEQLYIEEQIGIQLGITINLEFPASLQNELLSDKAKDGYMNIQPNETIAGEGQ